MFNSRIGTPSRGLGRTAAIASMVVAVSASSAVVGAWAAIPAANGVITACNRNDDGRTRIIDFEAGSRCRKDETRLAWNQQGPQGLQGPQGEPGLSGYQLVEGRLVTVPAGEPGALTAVCPPGTRVLGGGHRQNLGLAPVQIFASQPNVTRGPDDIPGTADDVNSWNVEVQNNGTSDVVMQAFATCAHVAQ